MNVHQKNYVSHTYTYTGPYEQAGHISVVLYIREPVNDEEERKRERERERERERNLHQIPFKWYRW